MTQFVERPKFDPSLRKAIKEHRQRLCPDWSWGAYNSPVTYEIELFGDHHGEPLRKLIAGVANPVVIDLMAPSGTLAELFDSIPDRNKLGIAVSLEDLRDDTTLSRDKSLGIIQIAGDLSSPSTWRRMEHSLAGRKANLIMEAANQGLRMLPTHPKFFAYALRKMWSMLDENGGQMIFSYLRADLLGSRIYFEDMVLQPLLEHGIAALRINYGVLYIKRKPEDPAEIPLYPYPIQLPQYFSP